MKTTRFPAVVTAAGAATRFRPFSSVIPKEMLPLGGVPAVEHVVRECLSSGASDVIVVTRPNDQIVPSYIGRLRQDGLPVTAVSEDLSHGYGNAAPLLTLRDTLAECEAFAVAFGDDILLGGPSIGFDLAVMRAQLRPEIDAVVAGQRIDIEDSCSFGIIDVQPSEPTRAICIRQRPDPATVTEPLAVVSRLILRPSILDTLKPSERAGGEVDLGIAVGELAADGHVGVHRIAGYWVTVGDPGRYLKALRAFAELQRSNTPNREHL